jgi:hypothetical protein
MGGIPTSSAESACTALLVSRRSSWAGYAVWADASECDFLYFPEDTQVELRQMAQGFSHGQPVEIIHNVVNDACRQSKVGLLSRQGKFHRAVTSGIIEDNDRTQPAITSLHRAAAMGTKPNPDDFVGSKGKTSLTDQELDDAVFTKTYKPGVNGYFNSSIATKALVAINKDYTKLPTLFLSLLAIPGTLLYRQDEPASEVVYVVATCELGVTCWNVTLKRYDGQRYICYIPMPEKRAWRYIFISDLSEWCLQEIDCLPPALAKAVATDGESIGVVNSIPSPAGITILRKSARLGFMAMTVQYLKRLAIELGVSETPQPKLEVEWATMLINHCVPGITDAELEHALEHRKLKSTRVPFDTELTPDCMWAFADVLGSDFKNIKDEAEEYARQVESIKKSKVGSAKPAAKSLLKIKKLAPKDTLAEGNAKKYLPKVDGCTLHLETEWHSRWRGYYDTPFPPFSKSVSFEPGANDKCKEALCTVLAWIWKEHEKAGGGPCPYDLS